MSRPTYVHLDDQLSESLKELSMTIRSINSALAAYGSQVLELFFETFDGAGNLADLTWIESDGCAASGTDRRVSLQLRPEFLELLVTLRACNRELLQLVERHAAELARAGGRREA